MADEKMVKHVVLDAGAFLRNAAVQNIGEKAYTIPEVVAEIRDKATKQRLQVLPYELNYREPSPEAIKTVTEFAKKTGDYGSLSAVDIRVMALTFQLEKENMGVDHIKTAPEKKVEWNCRSRNLEKATDIAGFYIKPKTSSSRTTSECTTRSETDSQTAEDTGDIDGRLGLVKEEKSTEQVNSTTDDRLNVIEPVQMGSNNRPDSASEIKFDKSEGSHDSMRNESETEKSDSALHEPGIKTDNEKQAPTEKVLKIDSGNKTENQSDFAEPQDGEILEADQLEEESDDSGSDDDDDDGDGGGWITPSNIKTIQAKMGLGDAERTSVPVGCLTTDFSMQNVLIQMGLNVVSVDGMLIKRARSYVLRCFACMKITTNIQKEFCPHCGNKTLTRVSMTVNEDGSIRYFLSKRPISTKGTNAPLPMPRGGKHANNPYLVEDQPHPQQRTAKKAQNKLNVFDPDYIANQSPFTINDVTSRASQLGIRAKKGQDRRNPNAGRKKRK